MAFGRGRKEQAAYSAFDETEATALGVLRFLAEQGLPATPVNFELGYLHRTDRESLAARAVDGILTTGERVSQEQADYIVSAYRALNAGAAQVEAVEESAEQAERGVRLRHHTLHLADLAADAVTATGQFGRDLTVELDQMDQVFAPFAKTISTMIARSSETEQSLVSALEKIDALHAEVQAAQNDAARDTLTGLANRRGLQTEIDRLEDREHAVLAICDIDRFKAINDLHGHLVGDRVIKAVADSIAASCAPHFVARWGGEEFVILMNGVSLDDAFAIVQSASAALQARTFRVRETEAALAPITFSAGVVAMGQCDTINVIAAADALLYRAKQEGRNKIVVETPIALAA